MKSTTFLFLLFFSAQTFGQNLIGIQWNDTHIGHNMGVFYEASAGDLTIGVGLTALLDNVPDATGNVYLKKAYGKNLKEKMGLNFSLSYPIYQYKESFVLRGLYRAFYANTRFSWEGDYSPRFVSHEHYLGLKVDIPISNRVVLTQSAGGGVAYIRDIRAISFSDGIFGNSELSYFVSVGLGYRFGVDYKD